MADRSNLKKRILLLATILFFCIELPVAEAQFGNRKREKAQQEAEEEEEEQEEEDALDELFLEEEIEEVGARIVEELDVLDEKWHEVEDVIGTYDGLRLYCGDNRYRSAVNRLLEDIHHYDTLLYDILEKKASLEGANLELRITLKEISEIEGKYKPRNFVHKLNEDCREMRDIEKNKKKLLLDIQMDSYDGRALIVDNDIYSYLHHITRLVDLVDKHAHHLLD